MVEAARQQDALRPTRLFRVHFEDESIAAVDVTAQDPDEARRQIKRTFPGKPINKIKIVRGRP